MEEKHKKTINRVVAALGISKQIIRKRFPVIAEQGSDGVVCCRKSNDSLQAMMIKTPDDNRYLFSLPNDNF